MSDALKGGASQVAKAWIDRVRAAEARPVDEGDPSGDQQVRQFREEMISLWGRVDGDNTKDRYEHLRHDKHGFLNPEVDFLFHVWSIAWENSGAQSGDMLCILDEASRRCEAVRRCAGQACKDDERIRDGFEEWLAEVDPDLPADAFDRITDENKDQFPFRQVGEYQKWLTEMAWEFFKAGAVWRQNHECKE